MNIVENGIDSFEKAVDLLMDIKYQEYNNEAVLKEIILSLNHSIEVLFKYILKEENSLLIYQDIEQVCKVLINDLVQNKKTNFYEFNTITIMDAVNRVLLLEDIKEISLNTKQYNCFVMLNKWRNQLTHFEVDLKTEEVAYNISIMIPILYDIFSKKIPNFNKVMGKFYSKYQDIFEEIYAKVDTGFIEYLNQTCTIINKFTEANNRVQYLNSNKKDITPLYANKGNDIHHICPCCNQKLFIRKGCLFRDVDTIIFYGECKYCNIDISKYEAVIIEVLFGYILTGNQKILDDLRNPKGEFYDRIRDYLYWLHSDKAKDIDFTSVDIEEIKKAYIENREIFDNAILEEFYEYIAGIIQGEAMNAYSWGEEILNNYIAKKINEWITSENGMKYKIVSIDSSKKIKEVNIEVVIHDLNSLEEFGYDREEQNIMFNSVKFIKAITNGDFSSLKREMKFNNVDGNEYQISSPQDHIVFYFNVEYKFDIQNLGL